MDKETRQYYIDTMKYHLAVTKMKLSGKGNGSTKSTQGKKVKRKTPLWQPLLALLAVFTLILGFTQGKELLSGGGSTPEPTQTTADIGPVAIPDMKGVERLEAERRLKEMGFATIETQEIKDFADASSEEIVIEQAPPAGQRIAKGDRVILRYGSKRLWEKGNTKATMPSVANLALPNARRKLEAAGFERIAYNLEGKFKEEQMVVTKQEPAAEDITNLNVQVKLTVQPGFQLDEVKRRLASDYIPFKTFAKIENPTGRDLKLTLANHDKELTTESVLNERARSYKVGIEEVLGYSIGKVVLVNPKVKPTGDSDNALRKVTDDGLTVLAARGACESKISANMNGVKINWETGRLQEEITTNKITLAATATSEDAQGQKQEVVASCLVSGTSEEPVVEDFSVK